MPLEQRDPTARKSSVNKGGKGEMKKAPASKGMGKRSQYSHSKPSIKLHDLRERIYAKAKAEPSWRFWGLYTHVCKMDTLREAYKLAKKNNGAPGIDGVTFKAIEDGGLEGFLTQIREELISDMYRPTRFRRKEIPKGKGKVRVLGIPTIRDRVVQGALKLILEPIFEADFQDGSYGYRPGRKAHDAINRVARAIVQYKVKVLDLDLKSYFDNIRHHIVFQKVAERVNDDKIMRLLKLALKANGKRGVPQGGVISPLIANLYLNELDRMLEQMKEETRTGKYTHVEYARYADDVVILVCGHKKCGWLLGEISRRTTKELEKVQVELNSEKSKVVDLTQEESFTFLGYDFRRLKSRKGKWRPDYKPRNRSRKKLTQKVKEIYRRNRSQPVKKLISEINPVVRGWVNYFRIGHSSQHLNYVKLWVEKKVRRHMMRARKRGGFGWKRWSSQWIYEVLGLYNDYRIRYHGESISGQ